MNTNIINIIENIGIDIINRLGREACIALLCLIITIIATIIVTKHYSPKQKAESKEENNECISRYMNLLNIKTKNRGFAKKILKIDKYCISKAEKLIPPRLIQNLKIELNPKDIQLFESIKKATEEATRRKIVIAYPKHYLILGNYMYIEDKYEDALNYYEKALKIDPNFTYAWINKGIVFKSIGKYDDDAVKYYDKLVTLDSQNKETWINEIEECKNRASNVSRFEYLAGYDSNLQVRIEAIKALAELKQGASRLEYLAGYDSNLQVRMEAIKALKIIR